VKSIIGKNDTVDSEEAEGQQGGGNFRLPNRCDCDWQNQQETEHQSSQIFNETKTYRIERETAGQPAQERKDSPCNADREDNCGGYGSVQNSYYGVRAANWSATVKPASDGR